MSEFTDLEQEARKDTRRAWKLILVSLILVFGLFVGLMLFYDCAPPDDSGIMPKFTESPGGHNPLAVFLKELEGNDLYLKRRHFFSKVHTTEEGITDAKIRAFVADQTVPIEAFEKLMRSNAADWRWPGVEMQYTLATIASTHKYLDTIVEPVMDIMEFKAYLEAEDGHVEKALKTQLQLTRYGQRLQGAEGTSVHQRTASYCFLRSLEDLDFILSKGTFDAAFLAGLQQEYATLEPRTRDYIMMLKVEALVFEIITNELRSGRGFSLVNFSDKDAFLLTFLKPNLTRASRLHYANPIIDGFTASWEEGWSASENARREFEAYSENTIRFYLNPNVGGNVFNETFLSSLWEECDTVIRNVTRVRQTTTMLAMRRYELEQGKLPSSLEDLVPNYLSAVPTDPFRNGPMLWNVEHKILYSVGRNGIDELGNLGSDFDEVKPDIGMLYWWSDEAKAIRDSNK